MFAVGMHVEQLAQLGGGEDQGGAVEVADEHRAGEKVGDDPDLEPGGEDKDDAGEDAQGGGQGGDAAGVTRREGQDGGTGQQADGGVGAGDDVARGGEQGVADGGGEGGVDAGDGRHVHQFGVGDDRGDHDHAGGDAGHEVAAQPAELVGGQDVKQGDAKGKSATGNGVRHSGPRGWVICTLEDRESCGFSYPIREQEPRRQRGERSAGVMHTQR